jgi:hypothetical protein
MMEVHLFGLQGKAITGAIQYRMFADPEGAIRNLQVFPRVISFQRSISYDGHIQDHYDVSKAEGKFNVLTTNYKLLIDLCQISTWGWKFQ